MLSQLIPERLHNQRLVGKRFPTPAAVVKWFGAVQAQEYQPARWGIGLRMRDSADDASIERAIDQGRILRTHVLRPTWHFVTPEDIHWLLELTGPRVQQAMSHYYRVHGLDPATRSKAARVIGRALAGGAALTRNELAACLARAGMALKGDALAVMSMDVELRGVMCSGPRRGKQVTYTLLDSRAPRPRRLSRDEALGELTRRYFQSRGPATMRDFSWWSGLTLTDAKRGIEIAGCRSRSAGDLSCWSLGRATASASSQPGAHLLPVYDEYLVAYRDTRATFGASRSAGRVYGNLGSLMETVVIDGRAVGTWRAARGSRALTDLAIDGTRTAAERRAVSDAKTRYERFLDREAV